MMEAEPITMPNMVNRKRALLARKLSIASAKTSLKIIVVWALASVLSNVFDSGSGVLVVAIREPLPWCAANMVGWNLRAGILVLRWSSLAARGAFKLLDVFQYGSGAAILASGWIKSAHGWVSSCARSWAF
jgi:hypothetical protein